MVTAQPQVQSQLLRLQHLLLQHLYLPLQEMGKQLLVSRQDQMVEVQFLITNTQQMAPLTQHFPQLILLHQSLFLV